MQRFSERRILFFPGALLPTSEAYCNRHTSWGQALQATCTPRAFLPRNPLDSG